MKYKYHAKLRTILDGIETAIVGRIPLTVTQVPCEDLLYALFLWYPDSTFMSYTLSFGFGTQAVLKQCTAQYSDKAGRVDCLWRPQQTLSDFRQHHFGDDDFNAAVKGAYQVMLGANPSDLPAADEGELFRPFREMMHRVAYQLNGRDWSKTLPVSKEFVVVSLDFTGESIDEDLLCSIPPSKQAPLKARGWL